MNGRGRVGAGDGARVLDGRELFPFVYTYIYLSLRPYYNVCLRWLFFFLGLLYDLISKFSVSLRLRLRWAAGMRGCEVESLRV